MYLYRPGLDLYQQKIARCIHDDDIDLAMGIRCFPRDSPVDTVKQRVGVGQGHCQALQCIQFALESGGGNVIGQGGEENRHRTSAV